jgi:hypothetical protein
MSNYSTDADVIEYEPTIKEYGVIDFSSYHAKTTADIQRHLRIEWWPRVRRSSQPLRYFDRGLEMDTTKLNAAQLKRAAVYHVLSYYILPQLTKHDAEPDRFRMMIDFYKARFRDELDMVLQDGVEYDFDNDGTVEDAEKQPEHFNRLVR